MPPAEPTHLGGHGRWLWCLPPTSVTTPLQTTAGARCASDCPCMCSLSVRLSVSPSVCLLHAQHVASPFQTHPDQGRKCLMMLIAATVVSRWLCADAAPSASVQQQLQQQQQQWHCGIHPRTSPPCSLPHCHRVTCNDTSIAACCAVPALLSPAGQLMALLKQGRAPLPVPHHPQQPARPPMHLRHMVLGNVATPYFETNMKVSKPSEGTRIIRQG